MSIKMKVYLLEREGVYTPIVYTDEAAAINAMEKFIIDTGCVAIIRYLENQENLSEPLKEVKCITTNSRSIHKNEKVCTICMCLISKCECEECFGCHAILTRGSSHNCSGYNVFD